MGPGEAAAGRLLSDLQLTDPNDILLLDKIVWARRALIREAPLTASEARLNFNSTGRSIITISNGIGSPERKRFSIAHELGHLELHARSRLLHLCSKEDIQYTKKKNSRPFEDEANEFASHFLLPKQFLEKRFSDTDPSFDLIGAVASEFQVSLTATALRFLDFTEEPLAVVSSQNGFVEWFQATPDFHDAGAFVDVHARVRKPSGAAVYFLNHRSPPSKWHKVPTDSWLKNDRLQGTAKLQEWSVAMPSYDTVLTLLWLVDDFNDDDFDL